MKRAAEGIEDAERGGPPLPDRLRDTAPTGVGARVSPAERSQKEARELRVEVGGTNVANVEAR
jgi:hypothetical protein